MAFCMSSPVSSSAHFVSSSLLSAAAAAASCRLDSVAASLPLPASLATKLCSSGLKSPLSDYGIVPRRIGLKAAVATSDDGGLGEGSPEGSEEIISSPADTLTAVGEKATGVADLKRALIDSLDGTDRGLKATSETRAEIVELVTQLEAKNPTPAPTTALTLLDGKWILLYTSFSELFPLLAAGTLPLVKVGEICQTINSDAFTVQNSVVFTGPLATTSFTASASFEIRSPKRVQIKFEEGVIGTPQLTDSIEIPESMEFLGQKIDLATFKGLFRSVQDAASSVAKTISGQLPLKFPIRNERAQSWLLTTYLDEDLRISRGDGGNVFVLVKEGSSLFIAGS
eukprot:c22886_g1_i1 orf=419-1441(-)